MKATPVVRSLGFNRTIGIYIEPQNDDEEVLLTVMLSQACKNGVLIKEIEANYNDKSPPTCTGMCIGPGLIPGWLMNDDRETIHKAY